MSREHSAMSRNIAISNDTLRSDYAAFRDRKIPKLLKRPDISEEDKKHLEFLKDTKKWFPYIMRHSSLSKIAEGREVNDYNLRQHAGWSKNSNMVQIYTHTLTGNSAEHVMSFYGINLKDSKKKRNEQPRKEMVGPHCPFCKMANIPDSQFCSSCHKPLSLISYNKRIMENNEEAKKELAQLEAQQEKRFKEMEEKMESLRKIALKQAFKVIEKEVESNPIPYIEGADKMTAHEVLFEMQKRGCNTLAFDDSK